MVTLHTVLVVVLDPHTANVYFKHMYCTETSALLRRVAQGHPHNAVPSSCKTVEGHFAVQIKLVLPLVHTNRKYCFEQGQMEAIFCFAVFGSNYAMH